jgi:hypothetical protein
MKIVCVGDSWTKGWDIDPACTWPIILGKKLNAEIIVGANPGSDNETITKTAQRLVKKHKPDLCIIGWSGVTRYFESKLFRSTQFSLSYVEPELSDKRDQWFENHSLTDILDIWEYQISRVSGMGVPIIMFSVFGDKPARSHLNFLDKSFLEYLANRQGVNFRYNIPIFEFGFLHEDNRTTEKFATRYFNNKWQYACVEREELRDSKYFLNCGHPNIEGHSAWAEHLLEFICQQ